MTEGEAFLKLESIEVRRRLDGAGYAGMLARLPAQSREAWALGLSADLGEIPPHPARVILVGLGGSAIGADVATTLATDLGPAPVQVIRNYQIPPLTPDTLVVLCSFSGNTEEVLCAFDDVTKSGARGIAISTGGTLSARASAAGMPLITYDWDGPPRTGLGYGVFLPLAILRRLKVLDISDEQVERSFAALDRASDTYGVDREANEARRLAAWIADGMPAIIGPDVLEVAARRWAGEMSENAKQVAASYGLPEFDHNQIEGAARPGPDADPLRFLLLHAPAVHPRNRLRVAATADLLREAGRHVQIVDAGGDTPIEAILASCVMGSWTSYYLSLLREQEPAPVPVMTRLKDILAAEQ